MPSLSDVLLVVRYLQLRADKDDHINRLHDQAAAHEAQLLSEAAAMSTELVARIDSLQEELESVMEYKKNRVRSCHVPGCSD